MLALSALRVGGDETRVRVDYLLHCGGCHRPDGQGAPPEIPSLHELGAIVLTEAGRDYIARVPGAAQAPINDAALANVLNWIVATYTDVGGEFKPLSAEEVRQSRARILAKPRDYRATLWPEYDGTNTNSKEADPGYE